VNVKIYLTA